MALSRLDWGLAALTALALGGSLALRRDDTRPNFEFLPDMARAPHYSAYEPNPNFADGKTWQPQPRGTIARGELPLPYAATPEDAARAGRELRDPLPADDPTALERGAAVFQAFCAVCHGGGGEGNGAVVQRGYPAPPSLLAPNAVDMPDGQMFHVITYGQGNMPPHAAPVERLDRWRAIRHVRALQAAAAAEGSGPR